MESCCLGRVLHGCYTVNLEKFLYKKASQEVELKVLMVDGDAGWWMKKKKSSLEVLQIINSSCKYFILQ